MPYFHSSEKERLRNDLLNLGKQLFIQQGLKKTSIEEMTKKVGIAKSTFYVFFESKEAMYLELLELEAVGMEERIWKEVDKTTNAFDGIKEYMHQMVVGLDINVLTKRLITNSVEFEMVKRKVTPEFVERKIQRNITPLLTYISDQQERGGMIQSDPNVIVGVIRAALLIAVHKQDIGEEIFPQVEEMMFQAVASSLTQTNQKE
ncbi:TetR/AcrR family transcriptional regulator [Alkalihalobacillus sp. TS-13]|uniref:TetR/AcrR family transcriptional regulator n=1 Tax=Alkalihalobacillus sp. TS-13 TaxID=2842455 RepID=UPI001C87B20B|nr:TetR/AcrR family transcriptional regulator [Alkalihalobacillus sp. TS-13]